MIGNTDRLMLVGNYAEFSGLSTADVFKRICNGDIRGVIVDGVQFVLLTFNEFNKIRKQND